MPCHAMLQYAILWYATICHAMLCHASLLYSPQKRAVIAARCSSSSSGRYMMMPTHECKSSSPRECAGLIGERERADHLCSMGAGTARSVASTFSRSSPMKAKSRPSA
uniref:Secreted protein n=1 Tax=Calcidiscus leptoporus TaxID=127549 RepID=A0A7S0NR50_9EUKA